METGERLTAEEPWLRLLLVHMAGRRVRRRVEIDDLVQEVYLRAVTAPGGLPDSAEGPTALRRFLARLARHTVIDIVRALRARKRDGREARLVRSDWSVTGVDAGALPAPGPGPGTRAVAAETEAALLEAFERLSPEHRRVIGLRQLEGLSAREAATRLGRSETAVHSLYRRALAAWSDAAGHGGPRDSRDESSGSFRSEHP